MARGRGRVPLLTPLLRQLGGDPLGLGARRALAALGAAAAAHGRPPTASSSRSAPTARSAAGRRSTSRTSEVVQIEGDPDSPDLARAAVPEGLGLRAARQQPAARDQASSTAARTAPSGRTSTSSTAMDMIADRVIADARARRGRTTTDDGEPLNRTLGFGVLGGATLDSEENYLIKKCFTAAGRGVDREPGPHMTLLHGPRSGDLVRARRRHHVPAGPAELRLHPDHGLEHGRAAPGRLPVGDGGQGARREGHPRRPALHAHERDGRPARPDPRRARDIAFLGG